MKSFLREHLPPSVWRFAEKIKKGVERPYVSLLRKSAAFWGYNIVRQKDYYSPLPVLSELKANVDRWNQPSNLGGIQYNLSSFKNTLLQMTTAFYAEFAKLRPYNNITQQGFGPGYTELDAFTLYSFIRQKKPTRYLEVGSGVSTYYCYLAARQNNKEGYPLHIQCIEPYPYKQLYSIPNITIYSEQVQNSSLSRFQQLEENDILFIDSSHVLKIDGDVSFLLLEVLPHLKKGVFIHIHDIPFPFNIPYPANYWILDRSWPMYWNEAMVLQAFLCFNDTFEIILSTPMLRYFEEQFLQKHVPIYKPIKQEPNTFSSLWLQKIK